ncbi:MAG: DUF4112 domain-containing protein [Gammaproteobacteria bacterium]|nr:DUF4112 domain-containing protein [Gammaproteobacteria bacterium]
MTPGEETEDAITRAARVTQSGKVAADSADAAADVAARRARLERLAWLLDDSVRIPWTQRRIGLESVLGLVPGIGDAVGGLLSTWILVQGVRYGVSRTTLMRMIVNVAIEVVVGSIPVFGDLFDMGWKANQRNVQLLDDHLVQPAAAARGTRVWLLAVLAMLTITGIVTVWAAVAFFRWVIHLGTGLVGY